MIGDIYYIKLPKKAMHSAVDENAYVIQLTDKKTSAYMRLYPALQGVQYYRVISIKQTDKSVLLIGYSKINSKTVFESKNVDIVEFVERVDSETIHQISLDVCDSDVWYMVRSANKKSSRNNSSESVKSGPTALTSIYYTGQKIRGGYNSHKG